MNRTPLLVAGIVLQVLLLTVSPASAALADYVFVQDLTGAGGGAWTSGSLSGGAVDTSGYVYVSQPAYGTIAVFSPSFQYLTTWNAPNPKAMAFNATGYLFVVNELGRKLSILDTSGTMVDDVSLAPGFPRGVAVNRSDCVFVAIESPPQVQVYGRDGSLIETFQPGDAIPQAITVNSTDDIIIGSRDSGSILVLDQDYHVIQTINTETTGIRGLAIDAADNILAIAAQGTAFQVYSPSGTLIGQSSGVMMWPSRGISVAPSGRVVVIDTVNNRVRVFHPPHTEPTPTLTLTLTSTTTLTPTLTPLPTPTTRPSTSFTAYPQSGPAPHTVQFLDYTPNGKEWRWDFGDGSTSTLQYPTHTYTATGLYTVSLAVTDWAGQVSTKTEYYCICITGPATPTPTPVANFTTNTTTGQAPLAVRFTDTSSPASFHRWWQFGDGASSTDRDPVHVYERTGAYTVNLTVWTLLGQATVSKPAFITVDGDPRVPAANFTLSRTSGPAPLFVRFTDASTGTPTSWHWDFGGLAWTTMVNPSVIFRQPGEYAVTLTVRNPYGWSSMATNVTVTGAARSAGGRAASSGTYSRFSAQ
ncbi:PKD domain protein [anaerobic digester metagenome]